jgi:hypothetical protein
MWMQHVLRVVGTSIKLCLFKPSCDALDDALWCVACTSTAQEDISELQAKIKFKEKKCISFGNIFEILMSKGDDDSKKVKDDQRLMHLFNAFVLFLRVTFTSKSRWAWFCSFAQTYSLARPRQPPLRAWGSTILASAVYREHPSSLANCATHKDFEHEWILWQQEQKPSSPFDVILTDAQRAVSRPAQMINEQSITVAKLNAVQALLLQQRHAQKISFEVRVVDVRSQALLSKAKSNINGVKSTSNTSLPACGRSCPKRPSENIKEQHK